MSDLTELPSRQMIFWKMGDWRCEYWKTSTQRRLIVFFRDEPLIDQPCTDAESVVLQSRELKRVIEAREQSDVRLS